MYKKIVLISMFFALIGLPVAYGQPYSDETSTYQDDSELDLEISINFGPV